MQAEVAELMGQHRLDLRLAQPLEQGVEEHDALVAADTGEVGVAVGRTARVVDHEHALGGEAAAAQQRLDARPERLVGERREAVEERRDERRPRPGHEQHDREPQQPGPQPPPGSGALHQQQRREQQRAAEQHRQHQALAEIGEEQSAGVVRLKPKRASRPKVRQAANGRLTSWMASATLAITARPSHGSAQSAVPPRAVHEGDAAAHRERQGEQRHRRPCQCVRNAPWRWCSRPPCRAPAPRRCRRTRRARADDGARRLRPGAATATGRVAAPASTATTNSGVSQCKGCRDLRYARRARGERVRARRRPDCATAAPHGRRYRARQAGPAAAPRPRRSRAGSPQARATSISPSSAPTSMRAASRAGTRSASSPRAHPELELLRDPSLRWTRRTHGSPSAWATGASRTRRPPCRTGTCAGRRARRRRA